MRKQSGFSFIELIVSTALIGILSSMALNSFSIYRHMVYNNQASLYIRDIYTSMENAKVEYNVNNSDLVEEYVDAEGTGAPVLTNTTVNEIVPGLVVDPLISLQIISYPQCILGNSATPCLLDCVDIRHCKTTVRRSICRLNDETIVETPSAVAATC